jgi:hypothetical protein
MLEIKRLTFDAFTKDSRTMSDGHRFSGPVLSPILLIVSFFLKQNVYPKTLQNLLVKVEELVKSALQNNSVALKSSLAELLSSLSAFEFQEEVGNPAIEALWYLYHTVLREQHWALVHSGLTSFGHFAEQTPCNELWRFVPSDPGLASDVQGSSQSGSDMFMSTLKAHLEKETMCTSLTVLDTDIDLLHQEARKQRSSYFRLLQQKEREIPEEKTIVIDLDSMDVDTRPSKTLGLKDKSKPDEVKTAILMLQEGFSLLSNISPEWLSRSDAKQEWRSVISQLAVVNKKLASL